MLNKIKIVGKVLSMKKKQNEGEKYESFFYFSLSVPTPSGSLTIIRCLAQGEKAEEVEREVNEGEILEVKGYLRNEKVGRQVLVRLIEFTKLNLTNEEIDSDHSNNLRLLGKIVTDFNSRENNGEPEVISFRIAVPREGNVSPLFFCRVQGELISEVKNKLKKGDIILLEGFLQTKKIVKDGVVDMWISSIICQGFTFLDNDHVNSFSSLEKLTRVVGEIEKIDFNKPKNKDWQGEKNME